MEYGPVEYGPVEYNPVEDFVIPGTGVARLRFAAKEHFNWNPLQNLM